jgi:hypothetical protein
MNIFVLRDMCCSLPILLDEYHNVLDVVEAIFSFRGGSNYNCSAGKDKEGVSKGSHFQLTGGRSKRALLIYLLRM